MPGYINNYENLAARKPITLPLLLAMKERGERIATLTCYDASFAALMDRCAVDMLLVGDSLGNVLQGHSTTLPVKLSEIAYHTTCVSRGNQFALLAADMPFGTYATPEAAYENAVSLMQAGAEIVKLEGGAWLAGTIKFMTERGVPVFAHLGLTPQSVHQLGGFRVQGKTADSAQRIKKDAQILHDAGASMLLLEAIPSELGQEITEALAIPTIGIGAGPHCSGQVLVMHDMLGVFPGKKARFVRNFMEGRNSIEDAIRCYIDSVRGGTFPAPEHCF